MLNYQLVEKGQTNIKVTSNVTGEDLTVYTVTEDTDGNAVMTEITESDPNIITLADGIFTQYTFTAPNEDCYAIVVLNGLSQFFRVGSPTTRIFVYGNDVGEIIDYTLYDFDGNQVSSGQLDDIGNGYYAHKLSETGDFIFAIDDLAPEAIHSNYVLDVSSTKMNGKVRLEPDRWMMLSLPIDGAKISDFVTAIENKYGMDGSDLFRVFSAFPSVADEQKGEMLDFIPGVTPVGSKYNFNLMYNDNGDYEITGFWVKTKPFDLSSSNYPDDEVINYEWSSNV